MGTPTCGMRSSKAPRRDIGDGRVDPLAVLGIVPFAPLPYWGWGDVPDQYRRSLTVRSRLPAETMFPVREAA